MSFAHAHCGCTQIKSGPVQDWLEQSVEVDSVASPITYGSSEPHEALAWHQRYTYIPPDEMTLPPSQTATPPVESTSLVSKKGKTTAPTAGTANFETALKDCNVFVGKLEDDRKDYFQKVITKSGQSSDLDDLEIKRWDIDMAKCRCSNEHVFQRTIMMEFIQRHSIENDLDYTCETEWRCPRLPWRMSPDVRAPLPKPRPDLAVAFKTGSIVEDENQVCLGDLMKYVCPEGEGNDRMDRAFHFFAIEAKRISIPNSDPDRTALHQILNVASLALYTMYLVLAEAGLQDEFFQEVRFFSAVASSRGVKIRIHRAVKARVVNRVKLPHPLAFRYDDLYACETSYAKRDISYFVKNILYYYGIKKLLPVLRKAMNVIVEKREKALLSPSRSPSTSKRQAEEPLAGQGSQTRRRVGDLDINSDG